MMRLGKQRRDWRCRRHYFRYANILLVPERRMVRRGLHRVQPAQQAFREIPGAPGRPTGNALLQLRTSLHFLGGFNFALAMFCVALAVAGKVFSDARQWQLIFAFLSLAHGTQFLCNLPVSLRERKKQPYAWPVLRGPMLFIFVTDAVLMVANAAAVAIL
jgi:hypothetical protein